MGEISKNLGSSRPPCHPPSDAPEPYWYSISTLGIPAKANLSKLHNKFCSIKKVNHLFVPNVINHAKGNCHLITI